jgi:hypothetical protein
VKSAGPHTHESYDRIVDYVDPYPSVAGRGRHGVPATLTDYRALVALHQSGTYLEIVGQRIEDLIGLYAVTTRSSMPEVMPMFLLGLATAKTCALTGDLEGAKPLAHELVKWLWPPDITLNALHAGIKKYDRI